MRSAILLSEKTTTGAGGAAQPNTPTAKSFQALGQTTAGAGSATVKVQGSNVPRPTADEDWVDLGTITLTLSTTKSSDGFVVDAPWTNVRGNLTAISGTGAAVTLYMGY